MVPNPGAAAPWGAIYRAQGCRGLTRFFTISLKYIFNLSSNLKANCCGCRKLLFFSVGCRKPKKVGKHCVRLLMWRINNEALYGIQGCKRSYDSVQQKQETAAACSLQTCIIHIALVFLVVMCLSETFSRFFSHFIIADHLHVTVWLLCFQVFICETRSILSEHCSNTEVPNLYLAMHPSTDEHVPLNFLWEKCWVK